MDGDFDLFNERRRAAPAHMHVVNDLLAKRNAGLNPWERKFLSSLGRYPVLSERQRAVLNDIRGKVAAGKPPRAGRRERRARRRARR
jgi:hypothetical protein